MLQPNRDPTDPYLTRAEIRDLVHQFSPRPLGEVQFYTWLNWLDERPAPTYSNFVAVQFIRLGQMLNRKAKREPMQAVIERLKRYLATFDEGQENLVVQEFLDEIKQQQEPQLVWIFPEGSGRSRAAAAAVIDI